MKVNFDKHSVKTRLNNYQHLVKKHMIKLFVG